MTESASSGSSALDPPLCLLAAFLEQHVKFWLSSGDASAVTRALEFSKLFSSCTCHVSPKWAT